MAGSASEDNGVGRSSEGLLSSQRCQSGDSQGEWRSSEQLESGTPSTSPPYWDTDEDDDGPKPSDLYGKFTWKIENFSQISKRELRSNAFEVGGYKWYILIYPQGCDVCNHLSLFLCVANHDKLLPGWSHFAQFTIAVVNKDPKKSKYSDTLHRFWKKEHDWGWKKFMELSKVSDGFIVSDTLVIKAQVQVIREKADRPFRCLDCQYRRELVRVYLSNVEKICRTFVEERRGKLGTLIEDKVRWSSFRSFWLGIDQNARRRMSREKMDAILKVVVRHFFIEKEVTSTLVMDSLYSGLKALECQSTNKKGRAKVEMDEMPAPIVNVDKDMFVLADDVLLLLERAAVEPLPPKDDKGPQNRTKDGTSGEEFTKDSIDREERRLTELGRRTVEIFVLAHIFSNQIEVAYQEAVALKRQEELIREEEAAGLAENELKAKRGVAEKEKRIKKKQAKQRRSSRKGKDRGREEKLDLMVQEKHHGESPSSKRNLEDFPVKQARSVLEKHDTLEDISNVSDTADDVSEAPRPDLDDRDACSVYWDTDTSEIHPSTEASSSSVSYLPVQNGGAEKKNPSVMDDSSSTCSTDSVPSVVMNGPYKGNLPNYKGLTSPIRGKKQRNKDTRQQSSWVQDTCNPQLDASSDVGTRRDAAGSCPGDEPESEAFLHSLKDRIQWLEQHLVQKQEEVVSLQQKLSVKDQVDVDGCPKQKTAEVSSSPSSPMRTMPSRTQPKQAVETTAVEPGPIRQASSSSPSQQEKAIPVITRPPHIISTSKPDTQKPANPLKATSVPIEKNAAQQVSAMSRPSSAPLIPAPVLNAPVVSMVQTAPSLSRSVSAAGRLGADSLPVTQVTHSYVPLSYRNAITGRNLGTSSATFTSRPPSSSSSPSVSYSQPPALASPSLLSPQSSARKDHISSGFTFGNVLPGVLHNQPQWMERSQHEANGMVCGPSLLNDIANIDIYGSGRGAPQTFYANELRAGSSARQSQGTSADEFPHLDIINSLFDEEQGTGKAGPAFSASNNGYHHHHTLNRQFTFPGDAGTTDVGSSINCCRLDHTARYPDDGIDRIYGSSSRPYSGLREVGSQVGLSGYSNGQVDGMIQNQWPVDGSDLSLLGMRNMEGDGYPFQLPDYSNLACGISGFGLFRPANGH